MTSMRLPKTIVASCLLAALTSFLTAKWMIHNAIDRIATCDVYELVHIVMSRDSNARQLDALTREATHAFDASQAELLGLHQSMRKVVLPGELGELFVEYSEKEFNFSRDQRNYSDLTNELEGKQLEAAIQEVMLHIESFSKSHNIDFVVACRRTGDKPPSPHPQLRMMQLRERVLLKAPMTIDITDEIKSLLSKE